MRTILDWPACHLVMQSFVMLLTPTTLPVQIKQLFPREGSPVTPPHPTADFKWKDYCPMAFRKLREVFNIDAGDYMLSVCGARACMPGRLDTAWPAAAQLPFWW